MTKDLSPTEHEKPACTTAVPGHRHYLDRMVLQFMARKISLTLCTLELASVNALPLHYLLREKRGRYHRILIFSHHDLLHATELRLVGFVSKCRPAMAQATVDEMGRVDELLVDEIAHIPNLVSYSSLELHPGSWYSLVLFRHTEVKTYLKNSATHSYAVSQLAPRYYEWIRLHNGVLCLGSTAQDVQLHSTKYYRFADPLPVPPLYVDPTAEKAGPTYER